MKTININFKQIIVLLLGVYLFSACSDREIDIITKPPCGFDFTSAIINEGNSDENVLEHTISFVVDKNGECNTPYQMKYEVLNLESGVVVEYKHEGNTKTHNEYFTITDNNFTDQLKVTGYDTDFSIKFTIINTGETNSEQTKTINMSFAEFNISTLADLVTYTKQTPEFTTNLTGGGPGDSYSAKLEVDHNFYGPMGAGGSLIIGGIATTFNTATTVTVPTGTPLTIRLTPTNAPSGQYVAGDAPEQPLKTRYKLTVTKNGVTKVKLFHLDCKRPAFDIILNLNKTSVTEQTEEFELTVDTSLLDGYNQNLTYDFEVDGRFKVKNDAGNFVNASFSRNGVTTSDVSNHIPAQQIFIMKTRSTSNNSETIYVTVKNQYNYIVEKNISIGIN